jgi:hypothetical protein
MRLPEFTAEASVYKTYGNYAGYSTSTAHPGIGSVGAQFDVTKLGNDYWAWLGTQHAFCQAPCWRDTYDGNCHCPTVGSPVGGPVLPPGIAR